MPRPGSPLRALQRAFEADSRPVYLVDADWKLAYVNEACARWLRIVADDLIGATCRYGADDSLSPASGLCPPPEAMQGRRCEGTIARAGDGQVIQRRCQFLPLGAAENDEEEQAVLAIVEPEDATPPIETSDNRGDAHAALQLARANLRSRYQPGLLFGDSAAMRRVRAQVALASGNRTAVLIVGPAGSGRQHVARTIHHAQADDSGPFVPLVCPVLGAELLSTTIVALEGQVNRAPGGPATLLLRDVDEMPESVQVMLVGRIASPRFPLRVMSTSRAPLDELAAAGRFHRELACALATITIHLPSLAERVDDLPLVAQAMLEELNRQGRKQLSGLTQAALDALAANAPAGGWDDLAEWLGEAHRRAQGVMIDVDSLPERARQAADAAMHRKAGEVRVDLERFLGEIELELIRRALRQAKGNKTKAARLLGMNRPKFYRRLEQLGLLEGD